LALADEFAALVRTDDEFALLEHHPFGLVCFRPLWPDLPDDLADGATDALMQRLNDSGALYLSHTRVNGRLVLRVAIGAPSTTTEHVHGAWRRILSEYHAMRATL
jgi:aromatic-L-amino-acid/L-tryptophan decarboxylase